MKPLPLAANPVTFQVQLRVKSGRDPTWWLGSLDFIFAQNPLAAA